jgi:hypothetical protein
LIPQQYSDILPLSGSIVGKISKKSQLRQKNKNGKFE